MGRRWIPIRVGRVLNARTKFLIDLILWSLAAPLALFARVDFDSFHYAGPIAIYTLIGLLVKGPAIYLAGFHRQWWRSIGVKDLETLLKAIGIGTAILLVVHLVTFPVVN